MYNNIQCQPIHDVVSPSASSSSSSSPSPWHPIWHNIDPLLCYFCAILKPLHFHILYDEMNSFSFVRITILLLSTLSLGIRSYTYLDLFSVVFIFMIKEYNRENLLVSGKCVFYYHSAHLHKQNKNWRSIK